MSTHEMDPENTQDTGNTVPSRKPKVFFLMKKVDFYGEEKVHVYRH